MLKNNKKIMSVQVTNRDLILLGHGSYAGGSGNTRLPENIDLYILQPIGYTLMLDAATALINQTEIKTLALKRDGGETLTIDAPCAVFLGGNDAPDLILYDLGSLSAWGKMVIGGKENVVNVNEPTLLSQLIKSNRKIHEAVRKLPVGAKLKLYWSACANHVSGNTASLK